MSSSKVCLTSRHAQSLWLIICLFSTKNWDQRAGTWDGCIIPLIDIILASELRRCLVFSRSLSRMTTLQPSQAEINHENTEFSSAEAQLRDIYFIWDPEWNIVRLRLIYKSPRRKDWWQYWDRSHRWVIFYSNTIQEILFIPKQLLTFHWEYLGNQRSYLMREIKKILMEKWINFFMRILSNSADNWFQNHWGSEKHNTSHPPWHD